MMRFLLILSWLIYHYMGLSQGNIVTLSRMIKPNMSPCLLSLTGIPMKGCALWQANVDTVVSYDQSRRLYFLGSDEESLSVIDDFNGRLLHKIKIIGRVITSVIVKDRLYFGTDKGIFYALDSYTFKEIFHIVVDSSINDDIIEIDGMFIFSTALGTVYNINSNTKDISWYYSRPKAKERLRMATYTNILLLDKWKDNKAIVVPHFDGYLSILAVSSGQLLAKINLILDQKYAFPDIVSPLVYFKGRLWVSSYDYGVFIIDLDSQKVVDHLDISGIIQLINDKNHVFMASSDNVYAISPLGGVIWQFSLKEIFSKSAPLAYPFSSFLKTNKRSFFGFPSRILLNDKLVILATTAGSMIILAKESGKLLQIAGFAVGFGHTISLVKNESAIVSSSKRGTMMEWTLNSHF